MQTSSGASEPEGECKLKKPQVSDEDIASSVQARALHVHTVESGLGIMTGVIAHTRYLEPD